MISGLLRRVTDTVVYLAYTVTLLFTVMSAIVITNDVYSMSFIFKTLSLTIVFCFILLCSWFSIVIHRTNRITFLSISVFITGITYLIWNIYAKTLPVSDYKMLMLGAYAILKGPFWDGFSKHSYFYYFNYQIGFSAYLAMMIRLLGAKLAGLKILEGLWMVGSGLMLYEITYDFINRDVAPVALSLWTLCIFNVMGSSVINNQHLELLLMLACLYFTLKSKPYYAIVAGIFLAAMNVIRPEAIIVVLGLIIYYAYEALRNKREWKAWIKKQGYFLLSFYAMIWLFNAGFIVAKLTPLPLSESPIPYYKLVVGLGGNRSDLYNGLDASDYSYTKYNAASRQFVIGRLESPGIYAFILNKMTWFLGGADSQYTFALPHGQWDNSNVQTMVYFGYLEYFTLVVLGFLAAVNKIKNRIPIRVFDVLLIGFLLVYVFIEVQTRYRYEAYPFLMICAAEYLVTLFEKRGLVPQCQPNIL